MNKIVEIIRDLISSKFYGKVTLSFENGRITLVRKEETIRL